MKPRLAIFLYSMAPGGAERVVSILLPELVSRYHVTLILMNDTLFYPVPPEVEVRFLEQSSPDESGVKKLLKLPWLALSFRRLCRELELDLALVMMVRPNYVAALAKMMGLPIPVLIGERGMPSRRNQGRSMSSRINRWLIRRLYPGAERIVTNSYGAAEDLIGNFGIPESKITVAYNPFDLEGIRKVRADETSKRERGFVVVTVGRLIPSKNQRMLLEAFAEIFEEGMEFWLIGDGPERAALEAYAEKLGIGPSVRFWGLRRDPFSLMKEADLFVFGSKHEGFPNVLVEAMACGLPVISTDCRSGPREILAGMQEYHHEISDILLAPYGVLVPEEDPRAMAKAMRRLYLDEEQRRHLARAALKRAEDFSKEKRVEFFIELLEKVSDEK